MAESIQFDFKRHGDINCMEKIAIIPARSGSKRLIKKNYKAFNSRTLVEIARDKCIETGLFDKIVITSDDVGLKKHVSGYAVDFLLRPAELASDDATTDQVMDFLFARYSDCESITWVNTVSPLQTTEDIKKCALKLHEQEVDCVMAINTLYQHCCLGEKPINFNRARAFEKTQDLVPISRYVYSCMGWKREAYVNHRASGFKGLFPGNMRLVEVSELAGMLVKRKEDFLLCENLEKVLRLQA